MNNITIFISMFLIYSAGLVSASPLECSKDKNCPDTATCVANLCQCPSGYVLNSDATRCLPIVIGLGATCEDHQQCAWLMGRYRCSEGRCDCEEGWRYINGRCVFPVGLNGTCDVDEQCFDGLDIQAMACSKEGICVCNKGYYLRGNYDCRPAITKFGEYCSLESDCKMEEGACRGSKCVNITSYEEYPFRYHLPEAPQAKGAAIIPHSTGQTTDCQKDSDCKSLKNSLCYPLTKKCICKRGFYLSDDTCVAELGTGTCLLSRQCPVLGSECSGGKCYCRKTYFYSKDNRACHKPMTHDHLFCTTTTRCRVMGTEVTCLANSCRCKSTAKLDEHFVCRPVEGGTGKCDTDEDCSHTLNAICSVGAECICPENYRREGNKCLPNFGGKCDNDTKTCEMEHSVCGEDQRCKCMDAHVQKGENQCIKVSDGLNDSCEIDEQCPIYGSKCSEGTCQCSDGYIPFDGLCYLEKYMGDTCSNSLQCHIKLGKSVQCRNSKCQCAVGMAPTTDGKNCRTIGGSSSLHISGIMLVLPLCIKLLLGY